ncbi:MAG: [Oscillospiraceae bacterium]|nr:[citrate (pro-3S)-lyase] ligase [Oscillospiraceae bacterium]
MELEMTGCPVGRKGAHWTALLKQTGLEPDRAVERTALLWEDGQLCAAGSRQGNLLKCIAVSPDRQGEGLTARLIGALRQDAFAAGQDHLFLYTKPGNEFQFSSLFFYPIAKTRDVLLMEDRRGGIRAFLDSLPPADPSGTVGAAVMNCNPFTLGHRYLIETAASECDRVYIFVLSEDSSEFSAADRMAMVRSGVADLENVTVLPTGPYLISNATFPTYFLREKGNATAIQCALDAEIFVNHYAPRFGITRRYVGTEPLSEVTEAYNQTLKAILPASGIQLREIPRKQLDSQPISASRVRALLAEGNWAALARLVPPTTLEHLQGSVSP